MFVLKDARIVSVGTEYNGDKIHSCLSPEAIAASFFFPPINCGRHVDNVPELSIICRSFIVFQNEIISILLVAPSITTNRPRKTYSQSKDYN